MKRNTEKRYLKINLENIHTRATTDEAGNKIIEGYASVFNQRSKLIFENGKIFYEIIERNAFDLVLTSPDLDVLLTYQHKGDEVLARFNPARGINTLGLYVDEYGLKFRAILPNTTSAKDTWENINAGNLYECSFVFTVDTDGQRWEKDEEGNNIRYILNISGLYDVSVVINGAYANTDVAVAQRSLQEFEEQEEHSDKSEIELDKMYVDILKAKG